MHGRARLCPRRRAMGKGPPPPWEGRASARPRCPDERFATAMGGPSVCSAKVPWEMCATAVAREETCRLRGMARLCPRRRALGKGSPPPREGAALSAPSYPEERLPLLLPVKEVSSTSAQTNCILPVFEHFKSHRKLQNLFHCHWQRIFGRIRHYINWVVGWGWPP
jgi:hypothetical protein